MVTLASEMESTAPPLKRPADFASRTIPVTRAPFGIATLPSTSTGAAIEAEKFWPVAEVLEPIASSRTTVIVVSAGTTRDLTTASRAADLPEELEPPDGPLEESFEESLAVESEFAAWSAGFWQPQSASNKPKDTRAVRLLKRDKEHLLKWVTGRLTSILPENEVAGKFKTATVT